MDEKSFSRRSLLTGAAVTGCVSHIAFAAGSDKPEIPELKVGFIPLTDCAPVVIASVKGFDAKYGIKIQLSKESSWAGVRDKLLSAELHASHALYGMLYGQQTGISGEKKDMALLMTINNNGQAITLSNDLHKKGVKDGMTLGNLIRKKPGSLTFAQTFPTGTHAMWLNYWLAEQGVHPQRDVKSVVIPPPQMVANMSVGSMDGFCVGEPWNARAIEQNIGFTAVTTQDIWPDHPEKVLGSTMDMVRKYPNAMRALTAAVLDAARFCDVPANRAEVAKIIAQKAHVNAPETVIIPRFMGEYEDGLGRKWTDKHAMKFYADGAVSYPYISDGMWFLTQFKRWGMLKEHPDYAKVAVSINQQDIYKEAAALTKTPLPSSPLRSAKFADGRVWDGSKPKDYADSFRIQAMI